MWEWKWMPVGVAVAVAVVVAVAAAVAVGVGCMMKGLGLRCQELVSSCLFARQPLGSGS